MYVGDLKVGAVYQSRSDVHLSRRITEFRNGIIKYVLYGQSSRPVQTALTEELFRSFTLKEIPPNEV